MFDSEFTKRAFKAFFRSGGIDQPANTSGLRSVGDKQYVVLENINGILAIYHIVNDRLRRLLEWPKALGSS